MDGSYFEGREYAGGDGATEEDQSPWPWPSGLSSPQPGEPPYDGGSAVARAAAARLRMATLDNIVVLMRYRRLSKDVLLRYENDRQRDRSERVSAVMDCGCENEQTQPHGRPFIYPSKTIFSGTITSV